MSILINFVDTCFKKEIQSIYLLDINMYILNIISTYLCRHDIFALRETCKYFMYFYKKVTIENNNNCCNLASKLYNGSNLYKNNIWNKIDCAIYHGYISRLKTFTVDTSKLSVKIYPENFKHKILTYKENNTIIIDVLYNARWYKNIHKIIFKASITLDRQVLHLFTNNVILKQYDIMRIMKYIITSQRTFIDYNDIDPRIFFAKYGHKFQKDVLLLYCCLYNNRLLFFDIHHYLMTTLMTKDFDKYVKKYKDCRTKYRGPITCIYTTGDPQFKIRCKIYHELLFNMSYNWSCDLLKFGYEICDRLIQH